MAENNKKDDKIVISITTLFDLRKKMLVKANEIEDEINKYFDQIEDEYIKIKSAVVTYSKTRYLAFKVAKDISKNNLQQKISLANIHEALYHAQEISTELTLGGLQDITEILTESKIIVTSLKTDLTNNDDVIKLNLAKTTLSQEVEFIMNNINKVFKRIDMRAKQCKTYISFVDDNLQQLNRLDSMIRLKQNILSNVFTESLNNGKDLEL